MISRTELIDQLLKAEEQFMRAESSPTNQTLLDVPIRELSLNKGDVKKLLGCSDKQLKIWISEMEEDGEFFSRNSRNNYLLDNTQVRALLAKSGIKTIPELRRTNTYNVPVVIINVSKGGVAKSTTSISLAVSSALDRKKDQKVLLIDTDPQGSIAAQICSNHPDHVYETYCELIKESCDLSREERLSNERQTYFRNKIMDSMINMTHLENLFVLPSNFKNSVVDTSIAVCIAKHGNEAAMSVIKDTIITPLINDFDLIIIDTPPASNLATAATYYASNHVKFITTGRKQDFRSYITHHSYLRDVLERLFPSDFQGFYSLNTIITRNIDKNDIMSQKMKENIATVSRISPTYRQIINENRKYEEAAEAHLPLQLFDSINDIPYRTAMEEVNNLYSEFNSIILPSLFEEPSDA